MCKLTLEKFEEASEIVRQVTLETKLVYSEYLHPADRQQDLPEAREYAGTPAPTRCAALTTRSAP